TTFNVSKVTMQSWLGLAYLILFGSVITFSAYTWLLTITSATRISTHTFINPVVAVIVGWALGGETLTWEMLVAMALIIISVYLILFRKVIPAKVKVEKTAGNRTEHDP
ncbi:MAG: EamA family transporter, partial [Bacteroidetes bacterium]|nr:EamA family transporter [Bacteroidota bacterium]